MDLTTLVIEVLFGAVFVATLVTWVRRRDTLSRDVMLVFASVAMLFVLVALRALVGPLPSLVTGAGLAALLAQPLLTIRLVHRIRPVPTWARYGALVAYLLTALPLVVLPLTAAAILVIPAAGVFVLTDALAAYLLGSEAARRVGSARARLASAAAGTALLALAIMVATLGSRANVLGVSAADIGRLIGLASALLYAVAFMPPAWLRRLWNAVATFSFVTDLTGTGPDADATAVWRRLAEVTVRLTGANAALVVAASPNGADVVAVGGEPDARAVLAGAHLASVPRHGPARGWIAAADDDLGRLAAATGAPLTWVLPFTGESGAVGALVLLRQRPSLFASDDHEIVKTLVSVASVFAERARVIAEQAALTEQLSQTVRALERASQAKSDFLASMSHELRTPLSAIIGFSALMREEPLDAARRSVPDEWIEHVHRSGQHLLALINDVLDLTKIEAGRLEITLEEFDLGTALAESVEGLRPLAERKELEMTLNAVPGSIRADRGRLRQIAYNLLSNAIKFTPEGGRVTVSAGWEGNDAHIVVEDSGVGIAADDLDKVFEEFSQVGDIKAREAGTGLGLALTRRLVEAHGGTIGVTSEPGAGSRFAIALPGARVDGADVPATASVPRADADGATVLLIEDDPGAIRLLRTYLEAEGYGVEVATDGETGVARARIVLPDAIILDVLLPGVDGWEVLRRLKADPELAGIPVVVVTVVDERNVAMSLGATDYFLKPVDPDALLARLGQYTFTTKVRQRRVNVLAIDDDPAARQLIATTLTREGFDVTVAASGREGLDRAAADPPDLVICDLVMPDLDGYAVVRSLQESPATRGTTILILTAHDLPAEQRARLNGAVADVLHKGDDLRPALATWLRRAATASRRRPSLAPSRGTPDGN